jgi:hypothetical protein
VKPERATAPIPDGCLTSSISAAPLPPGESYGTYGSLSRSRQLEGLRMIHSTGFLRQAVVSVAIKDVRHVGGIALNGPLARPTLDTHAPKDRIRERLRIGDGEWTAEPGAAAVTVNIGLDARQLSSLHLAGPF